MLVQEMKKRLSPINGRVVNGVPVFLPNPRYGTCDCCGASCPDANANLAPLVREHNHLTGHVRGYTCSPCNSHIGHFEAPISNPLRALQVLTYLRKTDPFWQAVLTTAPRVGAIRNPETGGWNWELLYVIPQHENLGA